MKSEKKKNGNKKKKSKKDKSKKQRKEATGKRKLDKQKSDKKSRKKSSTETIDAIQHDAAPEGDEIALATTTTNGEIQAMQTTPSTGNGNYGTNYAVFEWDGGLWALTEDCCNYGCFPQAPDEPGSYPGQRTVTACQPMFEGMTLPPSE